MNLHPSLVALIDAVTFLVQKVEAQIGQITPPDAPPESPPAAAGPKRGRPPGSKASSAQPAPEPEKIDYQKVRDAVYLVAEKKGHDAAKAVLTEFGVATGKELKPEQYADVLKRCETALLA